MSAFIELRRADFGVEPICRTLDVSASAYYQRKSGAPSARVVEDERLTELIRTVHEQNYFAYGYAGCGSRSSAPASRSAAAASND